MMTEREVVDRLYQVEKEGAAARDSGAPNPHVANTLFHFMHVSGWLKRDLQLALCKADPKYRASQINNVTEEQLNHA